MDTNANDKEILFLKDKVYQLEMLVLILQKRIQKPRMFLDGLWPDDVYYENKPKKSQRDAEKVRSNIEQHLFWETGVTGYCLKDIA